MLTGPVPQPPARAHGLRRAPDSFQTAVRTYRDTRRAITVVGLIHVAEDRYYHEVQGVIDALEAGGAVVHFEGVRPAPPDAAVSRRERRSLRRLGHLRRMYAALAGVLGLVVQRLDVGPAWVNVDTDALTIIRAHRSMLFLHVMRLAAWGLGLAAEHDVVPDARRERLSLLKSLDDPPREPGWLGRAARAVGLVPDDRVIVDLRDDLAAAAALAERRDVVTVWGAGHMEGIGRRLAEAGYGLAETRWIPAIRDAS